MYSKICSKGSNSLNLDNTKHFLELGVSLGLKLSLVCQRINDAISIWAYEKVQIGNDQEMAQSERNSHSISREVGKN